MTTIRRGAVIGAAALMTALLSMGTAQASAAAMPAAGTPTTVDVRGGDWADNSHHDDCDCSWNFEHDWDVDVDVDTDFDVDFDVDVDVDVDEEDDD